MRRESGTGAIMTTTTSADLDLLRARMAAAIGGRMAGHIERLGWSTGQLAGLQRARLPIMTKAQMMESFDEIVTDRRLTRDLAEQHLAGIDHRARPAARRPCMPGPGGSSGPAACPDRARDQAGRARQGGSARDGCGCG